jgi:hypothetical protein
MPTLGFHVPDDSPLAKAVRQRAEEEKAASVSAYVRRLVERDIEGGGPADAMSPTVLVDLAKRLCGELTAESIAKAMAGADQRRELQRMLTDVALNYEAEQLKAAEMEQESYGPVVHTHGLKEIPGKWAAPRPPPPTPINKPTHPKQEKPKKLA